MRFLIREQDFETPLAAGRFHYNRIGQPTGAYESWRLTEIAGGYRFLRVDMDTRETNDDDSTLYHLLIDPNGRPERLKLRGLAMNKQMQADIIFEKSSITVSGEVNGRRFDDELHLASPYGFYFPTALGFAFFLRNFLDQVTITAVTFDQKQNSLLNKRSVNIVSQQAEVFEVVRQEVVVHPYLIRGTNQEKKMWLDDYRLPLRIDFGNGQVANETQYIRYS
jgi:hypothetical protein